MTREFAKDMFRTDTDSYGKPKRIMTKINKIYDDFEFKEKELTVWLENKIKSNIDFREKVAFQEVLDKIRDIGKE